MKTILTALAVAVPLILAPTAHADENNDQLVFLQLLNMRGLQVYDTALTIRTGYQICDRLDVVDGNVVVRELMADQFDRPTRAQANAWLVSAVQAFCPWQDHTGLYT